MSYEPGQDEFGAVCPYLGLADDADSHATYATEAHRCYRLPNPTRIAQNHQESYCLGANHVHCPVYLGEGVPGAAPQRTAAAATTGALAGSPPGRAQRPQPPQPQGTVRGPNAREAMAPQRQRQAPAGGQRPVKRPNPGMIGPKPRGGGVSMPVATIGLFALALVVVGLAFWINNSVGSGKNGDTPQVAQFQTQTALANAAKTQPAQTQQPANSATASAQATSQNKTPTGSATAPANGAKSVTVKSGDTCFGIASANNVPLDAFLQANNMTEADCGNLKVGQVLKLP